MRVAVDEHGAEQWRETGACARVIPDRQMQASPPRWLQGLTSSRHRATEETGWPAGGVRRIQTSRLTVPPATYSGMIRLGSGAM